MKCVWCHQPSMSRHLYVETLNNIWKCLSDSIDIRWGVWIRLRYWYTKLVSAFIRRSTENNNHSTTTTINAVCYENNSKNNLCSGKDRIHWWKSMIISFKDIAFNTGHISFLSTIYYLPTAATSSDFFYTTNNHTNYFQSSMNFVLRWWTWIHFVCQIFRCWHLLQEYRGQYSLQHSRKFHRWL